MTITEIQIDLILCFFIPFQEIFFTGYNNRSTNRSDGVLFHSISRFFFTGDNNRNTNRSDGVFFLPFLG